MENAEWPARMQRLRTGPLLDAAPEAEFWLDGGHNAAAGLALVDVLAKLPKKPTHMICGMLNTKDVTGYLAPLAARAKEFEPAADEATQTVLNLTWKEIDIYDRFSRWYGYTFFMLRKRD